MTIPPSGQQRIRRPKKASGRYEAAMMFAAAALCAVAVIAAVSGGHRASRPKVLIGANSSTSMLASLDTTAGSDRPIYRHSVIPGGVYTPDELRNALVQDAIAATHYQMLDPSAVRAEVVKKDRFAYVSYRKDDQIYWTRNKVKLSEGETILTDGTNEVRARCGNCISETPRLPVAAVEPDSVELDQLVDSDPLLTAAIRTALESPASALIGSSAVPGAFGAGPAGGASPYGSGGSPLVGGGPGGAGGGPSFSVGPSGSPGGGGGQPGVSSSSPGDPGSSGGV